MGEPTGKFQSPFAAQTGPRRLDLICIGRGNADLYADQLGGRLEDAVSFSIYVGGSACNICIGAARLGLDTAMVLRVGDDHMGRLVRETLGRNGVDVSAVITDADAPTPTCILGVRDQMSFPRDLFSRGGAYLNLGPDDLDPAMFAQARAVLINGSFFASEPLRAMCRDALRMAREAGCATALDIDYRPALWGLVGHGEGEAAFVASDKVTRHFAEFLPEFDLVVGTEEEIAIAGGAEDTLDAVRAIRALSPATIVVKRGPKGCVGFDGPIPASVEEGTVVPGFLIDVMNTAGAGDSFMAGMAAGWLKEMPLSEASRLANACGAVNVARHGCSDSAPSWDEISLFLAEDGIRQPDAHPEMQRLHAMLGRHEKPVPNGILDLSALNEAQDADLLRDIADRIAKGPGFGVIWPATEQFAILSRATGHGNFIARDLPEDARGSDLAAGTRLAAHLRSWPREHVLRLVQTDAMQIDQIAAICRAARDTRHEVLVDLRNTVNYKIIVDAVLDAGLRPEWWLIARDDSAVAERIAVQDTSGRGVIVQPSHWRDRSAVINAFAADRSGACPDAADLTN